MHLQYVDRRKTDHGQSLSLQKKSKKQFKEKDEYPKNRKKKG